MTSLPPGTLPYLYGIARRVLSNQLRALHRRSRLDECSATWESRHLSTPQALIVQSSRDQEVVAAIHKLKPKDREILMLYAWEALSREAIAEMMSMTRAAIDQRIHRSYQQLARILKPNLENNAIKSPPIADKGGT